MSHNYDSTSRYRPRVHWNDENNPSSSTTIKKRAQRISLNASLPFYSKLNIRINTNRLHYDTNNRVKTTATIQRLDPQYEQNYLDHLRENYYQHYSTAFHDRQIQYEKLPTHRQVSVPISLPVDQRLFLYIRDGEIFARC